MTQPMVVPLSATVAGIREILVLTDFSDASQAALAHAAALARLHHAGLHVAHMVWVPAYQMEPGAAGAAYDWMLQTGTQQLQAINQSPALRDLPHRVHLEKADIECGLADLVEREHIDLIVLGSHGRRGLSKFLIGSVAEEVFRRSPVPVLSLGPNAWNAAPPAAPRRIVYATDLSAHCTAPQAMAVRLAQQYQAELILLHVVPPHSGEGGPEPLAIRRQLAMEALRRGWPAQALPGCEPTFSVSVGEPAASIVASAADCNAELIVLGAHSGHAWSPHSGGAVAYRVLCEAHCPVLLVRE